MFPLYFIKQAFPQLSELSKPSLHISFRLVMCCTLLFISVVSTKTLALDAPEIESPRIEAPKIHDPSLQICISKAMLKAQLTEAHALRKLKCHNKAINNVAGIEHFTGLEHLSLFGNEIRNADLRKLKNLKHINLAKNQLNQLKITGLSQLEALYLFKNELTSISFEGLGALQKMRIMQNKLNKLDISPLTSLEEAYLWDNQLEDLQITGLGKLVFLDVKQNPMPDELYDFFDEQEGITISHDGNADDWK